jgi:hypothetical protein
MQKSLKIAATVVLIMAAVGIHPTRGGDDQPKHDAGSVWMKQKLVASQNVLGGLTRGDFDAIEKNAKSMIFVGYLEKWVRADTPGYKTMLADFEYANRSLALAAKERNLDRATVAYLQLTLSCVNCHTMVRDGSK